MAPPTATDPLPLSSAAEVPTTVAEPNVTTGEPAPDKDMAPVHCVSAEKVIDAASEMESVAPAAGPTTVMPPAAAAAAMMADDSEMEHRRAGQDHADPGSLRARTRSVCAARNASRRRASAASAPARIADGVEPRVVRAGRADREGRDRHPRRHLHDREQRIESLQVGRRARARRAPAGWSWPRACPAGGRRRPRPR